MVEQSTVANRINSVAHILKKKMFEHLFIEVFEMLSCISCKHGCKFFLHRFPDQTIIPGSATLQLEQAEAALCKSFLYKDKLVGGDINKEIQHLPLER